MTRGWGGSREIERKCREGRSGIESPADRKLGSMLAFRDVNQQLYGAASLGVDGGVTSQ